jgi:hypothetical protein
MHHISRVGSKLGEGLTNGLNKIATTTHEIASTTSNLAMQLMEPAVASVSESPAALTGAAIGEHNTRNRDSSDSREPQSDFKILSEAMIRTIEEEIEELIKEKREYTETLKNLKEAQKRQEENFTRAEAMLQQRCEL